MTTRNKWTMFGRAAAAAAVALGVCVALTTVSLRADVPGAMELQIREVVAKDECGGKIEWGHDRMTLGAVAVQNGEARVHTLALGKFGHDNSKRIYKTPKTFLRYKVKPGSLQRFQAYLILAERDVQGGFGAYLDKFAARVPAGLSPPAKHGNGAELDAKSVIEAGTAMAATGLTVGSAMAIGKQVFNELRERFKDDIFTSHLEEIVVNKDGSFNRAKLNPSTQSFRAKNCHYTVTYQWAAK